MLPKNQQTVYRAILKEYLFISVWSLFNRKVLWAFSTNLIIALIFIDVGTVIKRSVEGSGCFQSKMYFDFKINCPLSFPLFYLWSKTVGLMVQIR